MIRGRLERTAATREPAGRARRPPYIEIDPGELSGVFRAPDWLRDAGIMSWLLVGIALLGGGAGLAARADADDRPAR